MTSSGSLVMNVHFVRLLYSRQQYLQAYFSVAASIDPFCMETPFFRRRDRRLRCGGLGAVGLTLSTGAVQQVVLAQEGSPPPCRKVSARMPL